MAWYTRAALLGSWLLFGGQKIRAWSTLTAYKDVQNVHGDVRNVFLEMQRVKLSGTVKKQSQAETLGEGKNSNTMVDSVY